MTADNYNVAVELIEPNLAARPAKVAFIDPAGAYTYADVAERADRCAGAFRALGLKPGDRILLAMLDGIDFVACFLGAIKAGFVPIPVNTLLTAADYGYMLTDSAARAAVVSLPLDPTFEAAIAASDWSGQLLLAGIPGAGLSLAMAQAPAHAEAHPTRPDDVAFWLYSSGSTGRPKGTLHRHSSPLKTAELFAKGVFGLQESDVVFSVAKLFFAYGLGNALTFPMSVGATAVLLPYRATPDSVSALLKDHGVTVFCGVPTLYAAMLAHPALPLTGQHQVRVCMSAGEALPEELGRAWNERVGCEIVDGIGSTEMLHIYVSNRPGEVAYGTTGTPVPGYEVKVVGEDGEEVAPGEIGELYVRGDTMATGYWNQPDKTAATFADGWMKTGDKFRTDEQGRLIHCGRADDMLKVGGIWVSPGEVENALLAHEAVLEAAVIGAADAAGLVKTKAFVVLKPGHAASPALAQDLQAFTKARLAPYKYPREIEFMTELPKTATGKIRRFVLRDREAAKAAG